MIMNYGDMMFRVSAALEQAKLDAARDEICAGICGGASRRWVDCDQATFCWDRATALELGDPEPDINDYM
jgi:hypothetical protein